MKKLILQSELSPGDIVMLTAAVRDLHRGYPGQFLTDVRTSCPELWENNPHLTPLRPRGRGVEMIECHYPLINRCNFTPYHCLHGYIEFLNERLGLQIKPTLFHGDIHLSPDEKSWISQVQEITGEDTPFWIVVAGGKPDVTIKCWDVRRYQQVIDHFRGRIQFVQVGHPEHYHPRLRGVIDLRGRTDLRQLVRLVYHAQGVLCPITAAMHLAAAVEFKHPTLKHRPCVVVAGGREPPHWEAYPHHQFIHTVGALSCCQQGGCWKFRALPLGDGDERDQTPNLCVDVAGKLPRCLDMITAAEVIRRIELYFQGGALAYLAPEQARAAEVAVAATAENPVNEAPLTLHTARLAAEDFIGSIPEYSGALHGRGIVICGGGTKYFACAWVGIHMLRRLGCRLPIQLWHLGPEEMDGAMRALVAPLGVECVDGLEVRKRQPARILNGWELKPYAVMHSPFREVLLLDADNVPVVNPEFLFETPQFRETGALFWPDFGRLGPERSIWGLTGVAYRDEPEFETGQFVLDKVRCWRALALTMWFNEHSDFFYQHVHGDKETFHLAFRKLNQPYAMPATPIHPLDGVMCQHDFEGRRIFQHRNFKKWRLFHPNKRIAGFQFETECLEDLARLRQALREIRSRRRPASRRPRGIQTAARVPTAEPLDGGRAGAARRQLKPAEAAVVAASRPPLSYCITCLGRRHHLEQTLPASLAENAGFNVEFVLLDYHSPDGLGRWIRQEFAEALASGRLAYYRTDAPTYFHPAHAKNVAHRLACGEILCNLDADNFATGAFTQYLLALFASQPKTVTRGQGGDGFWGRVALPRDWFEFLGGYDETMRDQHGYEDCDLVWRAHRVGLQMEELPFEFGRILCHSQEERWRNLRGRPGDGLDVNKRISHRHLAAGRWIANEETGWGVAQVRSAAGERVSLESQSRVHARQARPVAQRPRRGTKPCLVTVATQAGQYYREFLASCRRQSIRPTVLGWGQPFAGFGCKLRWLRAFFDEYGNQFTHLLFCDAYDVVLAAGWDEILDRFNSLQAPLVFCAERACYPDEAKREQYPPADLPWRFLNSGVWMGEREAVRATFDCLGRGAEAIPETLDDQRAFTEVYLRRQAPIALDHRGRLIQSLFQSERDLAWEAGRIYNRVTGERPVIFHGNGHADMTSVLAWLRLAPRADSEISRQIAPLEFRLLTRGTYEYHRVGYDRRPMTFRPDGLVGQGTADKEVFWRLGQDNGEVHLELGSPEQVTARLQRVSATVWKGRWLVHECMPVEITPKAGLI